MKKPFSYLGGKYRLAPLYGPPRRDVVCEPFAGSAGYSTYWEHPNVVLYDLDKDVCILWDWLINCSDDDILAMPDRIRSDEEYRDLPDGPRHVFL